MQKKIFNLVSEFKPTGDQPTAIKKLVENEATKRLLLGVTGSGKTFTIANLIEQQSKQVLILSPNKTLAAQLFEEFYKFFPENKVCYFVSYFDYYQPESYIPSTDTYIPKDSKINTEIERLRIEATASLLNRKDTIIIASVSAIYSLGNPEDFKNMSSKFILGQKISRRDFLLALIDMQYERNDVELESGKFRVMGNKVTINVPYIQQLLSFELEADEIVKISLIDKKEFRLISEIDNIFIFPAKHFVTPKDRLQGAVQQIRDDLEKRLAQIDDPVIKARLKARVTHDINMLLSTGYCNGIENYSSYFDNRTDNGRPFCLLDFFDKDFLFIIDESHIAIPQLNAMYKGDQSRKQSLVDFGFRLPTALSNRPLQFSETEKFFNNVVFVSATPGPYETKHCPVVAEQLIRPTGIVDPEIFIHPRENQLQHLVEKIKETSKTGYRSLVTVLTKKFAEELAKYLEKKGIAVCYMHSEIKTPQRTELLNKLRAGEFEALVGINLLREGLDLPEVAFMAIIDADIEGFLRNERSLIQTIGRAARNTSSSVFLYADKITDSMQKALSETSRRRIIQQKHNKQNNIDPKNTERTVIRSIAVTPSQVKTKKSKRDMSSEEFKNFSVDQLKKEMLKAAENKDFQKAIKLREMIKKISSK